MSESLATHLLYVLEILIACLAAAFIERWYDRRKNKKLDIGCDFCEKAIPLNKTPDKSAYLCRGCMEAFLIEHAEKFTAEQIAKVRKGYRRRKKGKKGK